MVRLSDWHYELRKQKTIVRILDALLTAAEKDEVLGFNELCRRAKVSKSTLAMHIDELLKRDLVSFKRVGKRRKFFITKKGADFLKALWQQIEMRNAFLAMDLLVLPLSGFNAAATVAVNNCNSKLKRKIESELREFTRKLADIAKGRKVRVLLSVNY